MATGLALLLLSACGSAPGVTGAGTGSAATPGPAVRYLPLGDSITEGAGVPGAYRTALVQELAARGLDVDLVGSQSGGPPGLRDADHEGHSGWCIAGQCGGTGDDAEDDTVLPRIDGWLQTYRPDVVSIHLGTNDLTHGATGAETAARLDALVGRVYADRPDTVVVLVSIIPMGVAAQQHDAYVHLVPQVASRYAARGRRISVVDLSALLRLPDDYRDALHPTQAGFDRMGRALAPAVSAACRSVR